MKKILGLLLLVTTAYISPTISQATALEQKIHIRDSHGKWTFDAPPKRIAVINWTLTEQLLELNVSPIAIADFEGFRKMSPQTSLPANSEKILDLGSRFSPSLEELKETKPDLILIGYSQRDLLRPLSNIAPVMYFNNFSRRYQNEKKADERFLILAKLFQKTEFAKLKLDDRNKKISHIKAEINTLFNGSLPTLTIASSQKKSFWVFLENSIPFAVAKQLGFDSNFSEKVTKFGTHKINQEDIFSQNGCVFLINNDKPSSANKKVFARHSCSSTMENTNTYGGAMSQLYIASAILNAFKKISAIAS